MAESESSDDNESLRGSDAPASAGREDEPGASSPAEQNPSSGWRDDPLSIFLIAAALLLAGMYGWDEWQRSTLERQIELAEQIDAAFAIDGVSCAVGSAGLHGEQLVISCERGDAAEVAKLAGDINVVREYVGHFESVGFRVGESAATCPPQPDGWPENCQ